MLDESAWSLWTSNGLLTSGCQVVDAHWSLHKNVGGYNQVQEDLPLSPPWDQAPGPSNSTKYKFVLAQLKKKIKNKNGFQNCYGITSVFFKKTDEVGQGEGNPHNLLLNFGR